jgi:ABC-type lipoprotein release transport system permease subunit
MPVLAAIRQGAVFAVVFLTSLAISVTGTGIGTLTGFIDLLRHFNSFIVEIWESVN